MPIYEYDCAACGEHFEALVLGRDSICCPKCQSEKIERRMSTFSHKASGGKFVSSQGSGCSGCTSGSCATCHCGRAETRTGQAGRLGLAFSARRPGLKDKLTIATRGSKLALAQAGWVAWRIESAWPGLAVDLATLTTRGDNILDSPLAKIGGKGLFVKEIQEAVLSGRADLAVHSVKDLPVEESPGLVLADFPLREDRRDALVSASNLGLERLSAGSRVGTSSLRRAAQLLAFRPDLIIVTLRGNVDTRLRKLREGLCEATVLALAGLKRLGLEDQATEILGPETMLPAVGQGALAVECRAGDPETIGLLKPLDDAVTRLEIEAERAFLARLQGGCQVPIAGSAEIRDRDLVLAGLVASLDGKTVIRRRLAGPRDDPSGLGRRLAEEILSSGGREILEEVYGP